MLANKKSAVRATTIVRMGILLDRNFHFGSRFPVSLSQLVNF
jgi:hypothetical protein